MSKNKTHIRGLKGKTEESATRDSKFGCLSRRVNNPVRAAAAAAAAVVAAVTTVAVCLHMCVCMCVCVDVPISHLQHTPAM